MPWSQTKSSWLYSSNSVFHNHSEFPASEQQVQVLRQEFKIKTCTFKCHVGIPSLASQCQAGTQLLAVLGNSLFALWHEVKIEPHEVKMESYQRWEVSWLHWHWLGSTDVLVWRMASPASSQIVAGPGKFPHSGGVARTTQLAVGWEMWVLSTM